MKLIHFNPQKARVLHNFVAFKWIKVDEIKTKYLDIVLPANIVDRGGQGRMGHKYTCEVLAIGPKVTDIKPGDRFLLHEYDKVDQSTTWDKDSVMFCEDNVVTAILPKSFETMIIAKEITDKMMDKYEDY